MKFSVRTLLESRRAMWLKCQRGAVLVFVGISIPLLLAVGALAVDMSALESQGQTLQNAADAAALAAVAEWSDSSDAVQVAAVVQDVVGQNGASHAELVITYPAPGQVQVALSDADPQVLLGNAVWSRLSTGPSVLTRDATAELIECIGCSPEIEVPIGDSFVPIANQGSGDGFIPIEVGSKIYALNHSNRTLQWVDKATNEHCWSAKKNVFPENYKSTMSPRSHVLGDYMFFSAYRTTAILNGTSTGNAGTTMVRCWDTVTDTACGAHTMTDVGRDTLVGIDDRIFLFTDDRKVRCVKAEPALGACPGYPSGGLNTELSNHPDFDFADTWNGAGDARVLDDGRIYVTLSDNGRDFLHCWDSSTDAICPQFGAVPLNGSRVMDDSLRPSQRTWDNFIAGRLFFYRDSVGTPVGICSLAPPTIEAVHCLDLTTGVRIPGFEAALNSFATNIEYVDTGYLYTWYAGVVTYYSGTNRIFANGTFEQSTTYCFDFDTESSCGSVLEETPYGNAQGYGYIESGGCLLGLGHVSVFYSMSPDLTGACGAGSSAVSVDTCMCGTTPLWPSVTIENTEGVREFNVRVLDSAGDQVMPLSGEINLMSTPLDLSTLNPASAPVTLEFSIVNLGTADPWADGVAPMARLTYRSGSSPLLVE